MRAFFDSSSFAKRFLEEPGSQEVEDLCDRTSALGVSALCRPEIISALNRRLREKQFTRQSYLTAKHRLDEDLRDADVTDLYPAVIDRAVLILETNTLRTLDALHVASALDWQAELFVSSDQRQIKAARKAGLPTRYIAKN